MSWRAAEDFNSVTVKKDITAITQSGEYSLQMAHLR
jgi:hypothetical protein